MSSATLGLLPWVELVISVTQTKVGDKYKIDKVVTNPIGLTLGIAWEQTSFGQVKNGNTTTITLNGISSISLFVEGIGTVYSTAVSYSINIDNKTGKLVSAKRLNI